MRSVAQTPIIAGRGGLAVKLLSVCAAAALSGCLLPQDDQVLPRIPSSQNLPPVILDTGRKPIQTPTVVSSCASRPEFQVLVKDDSQTIQHKWFIDPKADYTQPRKDEPTTSAGDVGENQNGSAETIRVLKAPGGFFTRLATVGDDMQHRIDVVITDGNLVDEPNGALGFSPNSFGKDELNNDVLLTPYHVIFTWLVRVQKCP